METQSWVVSVDGNEIHTAPTLLAAMQYAKTYSGFVSIKGHGYEVVGKFGVDAVENKMLPDGNQYDWTMRRDETHRSSRKKLV